MAGLAIDTSLHYPEDATARSMTRARCGARRHPIAGTRWVARSWTGWSSTTRSRSDHRHHGRCRRQILQSDFDLYGGAHVAALVARFGFWGMVNPADYMPTITHTPLGDTEDTTGPYPVVATITSVTPLEPTSLIRVLGSRRDHELLR